MLSLSIGRAFKEIRLILLFMFFSGVSAGLLLGYFGSAAFPYLHFGSLALPLGVLVFIWLRLRRFDRDMDSLALGRDGERAMAERLDELKRWGYRVFHDIPSQREAGANIDHLVIGPGGIFVIETKMRSKPRDRDGQITYDGKKLVIDGYTDSASINQVLAVSREFSEWLERVTGRSVSRLVRPVLVFPGWFITEHERPRPYHEWVLNERSIVKWISMEKRFLSNEDIALYSSRVEDRVREYQQQRS